jgi:hypothetical protein
MRFRSCPAAGSHQRTIYLRPLGSNLVGAKPSEMTRQWDSVGSPRRISHFGIAGRIIPQELA